MEDLVRHPGADAVAGLPDPTFWSGRRVLVTGHTGFIGGWTCAWLHALGCDVTGYALPPLQRSFYGSTGLGGRIGGVMADIRSRDDLAGAFSAHRPDTVIHLAGQPIVRESYERPLETFDVNLMGTVHVLEQARIHPPDAIVAMTSDKVYAPALPQRSHLEDDRLGPGDPYGNSKACCELAIEAYASSFLAPAGIGVATVRAGNVIGGGDWGADRLIPDAIRAFSAGEALSIRHPTAVRPWQHVLDAVNGLLLVAERAVRQHAPVGAWNIGPPPGSSVDVGTLAQLLADAWQDGARVSFEPRNDFLETHYLAVDSARARGELALVSPWTLQQAVGHTVAWYWQVGAGADAWTLAQEQIAVYGADRAVIATAGVIPSSC